MNGTVLNKTELAAWRSLIARPDAAKLALAAGIYFLSALIIPFSNNESLALVFLVVCAVFYCTQTHSLLSLIVPAIPVVFLFSLGGSMFLPANFVAIVFGGAAGAMLLLSVRDPKYDWALVFLPILAYMTTLFFRGDPINALLTLLPLPGAVVGMLGVRHCKPFSRSIAAIAVALAATLLVAGGITLVMFDLFDLSLLPLFIESLGDELIAVLDTLNATYPDVALQIELSPTLIRNMLAIAVNLSPGLFAIICTVTAYFVWRTLNILLVSFGALPRLPRIFTTPIMSVPAAVLFILASLVSFFANASLPMTMVGAVAENLSLVLMPGFVLIGLGVLLGHNRAQRSCLSLLLLIGLVYLIFYNPITAFSVAALFGAIHSLIFAYRQFKKRKGEP